MAILPPPPQAIKVNTATIVIVIADVDALEIVGDFFRQILRLRFCLFEGRLYRTSLVMPAEAGGTYGGEAMPNNESLLMTWIMVDGHGSWSMVDAARSAAAGD